MQVLPLDFAASDQQAGFRLQRLEVLNWGTFDRHVWRIEPLGANALLTGDIGSGKSTLVDAVTTLMVPHHRIVYNKAAGGEGRERTLYSYIRGEYKSEKDDLTQSARAVTLRDDNTYSVLLAYFYNAGYDQGVTLAQVFWLKDHQRNPERFFVLAEAPLTIAEHFGGFGSDILDLRKRLRRTAKVQVLDHFKEYGNRFRQMFGIQNEQALELFYQTVSMKSVGNLTEFVRQHMLEKSNVENRIEELRRSFDNLNRAHEAVLKAKRQVELLTPLVEDGGKYQVLAVSIEDLRRCREALVAYFAAHENELLQTRLEQLDLEWRKVSHRLETLKDEIAAAHEREQELTRSIEDQGGRRIQELEREIDRLGPERVRRQKRDREYRAYLERLELDAAPSEDGFYQALADVKGLLMELAERIETEQLAQVDMAVKLRDLTQQHKELSAELDSLRRRKSKIPSKNLEIRAGMAQVLGLDEEALPFVGELLQVDEAEQVWEGAIERLLHNFGLSLLVPEALYTRVSRYVDRTHLRGRLVYYRIREADLKHRNVPPLPNSLVRKLRLKPDTEFYTWLEQQLLERFDYACCDSLDEFRRQPYAVTRNGQIKTGQQRHEKDDRRAITDSSHYILGWSNESKIQTLEQVLLTREREGQGLGVELATLQRHLAELNQRRDYARDLLKIEDYGEIHWQAVAAQIQTLLEEKQQIEQSSNILQSLRTQLEEIRQGRRNKEHRQGELLGQRGKLEQQQQDGRERLQTVENLLATLTEEERQTYFPKLDGHRHRFLPERTLNLRNLERCQRELREAIQNQLNKDDNKSKRLVERLLGQMKDYKNDYPAETVEVDAALAALPEYRTMLEQLQREDLPRHEARFKELLNEGTINGIALFQSQLEKEKEEIQAKIRAINTSLREIEYNPGTYIELVMDKTQDREVRDFQQDLRQCLAHGLGDEALYNETKFLQVKAIIERFSGREGQLDLDRRWTRKVTDVRNWFGFSASERWCEDDSEREFYSDSAGKSGGQKEKLAYTILASALAYQFGLEWGVIRSRSFRFVVIDEAFGKGSDDSTRYGLELFKKLNLQLLIVTPLQKINIIEDYIKAVHFVHNESGNCSMLKNLTQEEYREEKRRYLQGA